MNRVDKPIGEGTAGTVFKFIEGSRTEKKDHVFPLRVTLTVKKLDDGKSELKVQAHDQGLMLTTKNKEAKERWEKEIKTTLQKQ